jgi:hypothetical protein
MVPSQAIGLPAPARVNKYMRDRYDRCGPRQANSPRRTTENRHAPPVIVRSPRLSPAHLCWHAAGVRRATADHPASELAARLDDPRLRIVDIRGGKDDAGKTPYELGHSRRTLSALFEVARTEDNPGKLPAARDVDRARAVAGHRCRHSGRGGQQRRQRDRLRRAAARVYWTLKVAGLARHVSLLNGGFKGVARRRLAGDYRAVDRDASTYRCTIDRRLIATQEEVAQAIAGRACRCSMPDRLAFFTGETRHVAATTPGTLVGARNVDHSVWFAKRAAARCCRPTMCGASPASRACAPTSRPCRSATPAIGPRPTGSCCPKCSDTRM